LLNPVILRIVFHKKILASKIQPAGFELHVALKDKEVRLPEHNPCVVKYNA